MTGRPNVNCSRSILHKLLGSLLLREGTSMNRTMANLVNAGVSKYGGSEQSRLQCVRSAQDDFDAKSREIERGLASKSVQ
jgi:hypothetical protein